MFQFFQSFLKALHFLQKRLDLLWLSLVFYPNFRFKLQFRVEKKPGDLLALFGRKAA